MLRDDRNRQRTELQPAGEWEKKFICGMELHSIEGNGCEMNNFKKNHAFFTSKPFHPILFYESELAE